MMRPDRGEDVAALAPDRPVLGEVVQLDAAAPRRRSSASWAVRNTRGRVSLLGQLAVAQRLVLGSSSSGSGP